MNNYYRVQFDEYNYPVFAYTLNHAIEQIKNEYYTPNGFSIYEGYKGNCELGKLLYSQNGKDMKTVTIELDDDFNQVITMEVECNYIAPEPEIGFVGGWTADKVLRASISVCADFTNSKELIVDLDVNEIDLDPETVQEQIDSLV